MPLVLMELIGDILPPDTMNGFGAELELNKTKSISKVYRRITTDVYATENIILVTKW
jgi:hypothetical protein